MVLCDSPFTTANARSIYMLTAMCSAEFADNGYKDGFAVVNNTENSFLQKGKKISVDSLKANAVRSYFEWMPIR